MKKKRLDRNPLDWIDSAVEVPTGVQLSNITYVHPGKLTNHNLNSVFFKVESKDYFDKLRTDISERGILVPLIAKIDGTLLSGHNRLKVAQELELTSVPVQYVLNELDLDSEKEFLIKDNLLRRQFTQAEWIQIYRNLYPDFDQEIIQEKRGGGKKWSKPERSGLLKTERLTAKKIAADTGQKVAAVEKQLTKYRKSLIEKPDLKVNQTSSNTNKQKELLSEVIKKIEFTLANSEKQTIIKFFKEMDLLKKRILNN